MQITRHDCGFAAFECDATTCDRDCFTARYIELKATYAPEPPLFGPAALAFILAASIAALACAVAVGPPRMEQQFQADARR